MSEYKRGRREKETAQAAENMKPVNGDGNVSMHCDGVVMVIVVVLKKVRQLRERTAYNVT